MNSKGKFIRATLASFLFWWTIGCSAKGKDFGSGSIETESHGAAHYNCNAGKWISAEFHQEPVSYVSLTLSDGRRMNLAQVLSASGVRYANITETIEFRSKGSSAFIQEGEMGEESKITYDDCEANTVSL
jgi:membrane-bound inhibitor of C-type lysozyme